MLRLLYNHNPFYLVSALLVLKAAPALFAPGDDGVRLLALLAGYTALLAVAGVLVIRAGGVWEDARSILLVLVLLFIAMSACFDEDAIARPERGAALLGAAWLFAAGVSEAVLRAAGIRLRRGLRLPYHALLALFFGYPLALAALLRAGGAGGPPLASGILAFPLAASTIALALIPAVRRGPRYVARSGTPWSWPLFPWSLFFVLGAGVALRTRWLVAAYLPAPGAEVPWGAFLLSPILLAAAALALESGIATGSIRAVRAGLRLPAAAIACALHTGARGPGREALLGDLAVSLGSPVTLVAIAAAAFYAIALARRVRAAETGLLASLAVLAASTGGARAGPHPLPLALISLAAFIGAARTGATWRALAGGAAALLALGAGQGSAGLGPLAGEPAASFHAAYFVALASALALDDPLARALRDACAYTIATALAAALWAWPSLFPDIDEAARIPYASMLFCFTCAIYGLIREPCWLRAVLLEVATALVAAGAAAHGLSESSGGRGGALLFWSGASFALASLVSASKSGALAPAVRRVALAAGLAPRGRAEEVRAASP
jgi:hypothetical protein